MTSPLERHLDAARERFTPEWDEARAERVEAAMHGRARARRRARVALAGAAVVLLAAVVWMLVPAAPDVVVEPLVASVVTELPPTPDERAFEVTSGTVRVVAKASKKPVRVVVGDVEVVVMGTQVLVERAGVRASVLVEEGSAEVRWPGGRSRLAAGERRWFPPDEPEAASPPREEAPATSPAVAPPPPAPTRPPEPRAKVRPDTAPEEAAPLAAEPPRSWQELARAGEYDLAWDALRAVTPADETGELLLAADVARLSGHSEAAVAPLRRVVDTHATDARAPLAAFTLGRVLLDDLGRPAEAAVAFEAARTLAPSARLSEDALARQVEAAFRAQDPRARELAERFVKDFPSSPRVRAVRYFGGLEK